MQSAKTSGAQFLNHLRQQNFANSATLVSWKERENNYLTTAPVAEAIPYNSASVDTDLARQPSGLNVAAPRFRSDSQSCKPTGRNCVFARPAPYFDALGDV